MPYPKCLEEICEGGSSLLESHVGNLQNSDPQFEANSMTKNFSTGTLSWNTAEMDLEVPSSQVVFNLRVLKM